jgi:presenilin-like A22 family membrane protease
MKHNKQITLILISMFLITQLIGLAVIYADPLNISYVDDTGQTVETQNPALSFIQPPEIEQETDFISKVLPSIVIAFVIAIVILFLLTHLKAAIFIRIWFFIVVSMVVYITAIAFFKIIPYTVSLKTAVIISAVIGIGLAYFKIFKRNLYVHNITELLIYPGIAVVFVPLLNIWSIIILLIIISLYDMWAVWHSGFMQKMANFQINELKIFGGFFVPYLNKKQRAQVKNAKIQMKKGKKVSKKNMKVNLAILGGGDVVFPIITTGVVFNLLGIIPALMVTLGATIALALLLLYSQKGKFYPAMPFITAGLLAGIIVAFLI